MQLLFIDHFDSFTNNLTSWFEAQGVKLKVVSYHELTCIKHFDDFHGVIFSPGPGHPRDYQKSIDLYNNMPEFLPFLGICLGHQILLHAEGGDIVQIAKIPEHGRQVTLLSSNSSRLLSQDALHGTFVLYNSLGCHISDHVFHKNVISLSHENGINLALEHKTYPRIGVQFHPESFASPKGFIILNDFLRLAAC